VNVFRIARGAADYTGLPGRRRESRPFAPGPREGKHRAGQRRPGALQRHCRNAAATLAGPRREDTSPFGDAPPGLPPPSRIPTRGARGGPSGRPSLGHWAGRLQRWDIVRGASPFSRRTPGKRGWPRQTVNCWPGRLVDAGGSSESRRFSWGPWPETLREKIGQAARNRGREPDFFPPSGNRININRNRSSDSGRTFFFHSMWDRTFFEADQSTEPRMPAAGAPPSHPSERMPRGRFSPPGSADL